MTEFDTEFHPLSASASGNNAFNLDGCDLVGHRPPYAACLFKIGEWNANRLGPGCATCATAMSKGECQAQKMRAEETLAGKSLYYIDRLRLRAECQARDDEASERRGRMLSGDSQEKPSRRAPPQRPTAPLAPAVSAFIDPNHGGYADAINIALREMPPVLNVPPLPVAPVVNVAKAGMSMVEIARAAMAQATL